MNNATTARLPLRLTETVSVLVQVIEGKIVRDSPNGQYRSVLSHAEQDLGRWCAIGESLNHSFKVERINDTYTWGNKQVPRKGLLITLIECETKKTVEFYLAGHENVDAVDNHMCSLTDDLLEQWFKDRSKKTKEDRDREKAEKKAKQAEEAAKPDPLAGLKAHIEKTVKKARQKHG